MHKMWTELNPGFSQASTITTKDSYSYWGSLKVKCALRHELTKDASMTKALLEVLKGKAMTPPPVWFMRQAGRHLPEYRKLRADIGTFLDLCYSPKDAAEVSLQPIRRYAMDGTIMFADILLIPDALGQKVEFKPGVGPVLEPLVNKSDLDALSMAGMGQHLGPIYETMAILKDNIPPTTTLIGFAGAPWTVASYMVHGSGSRDHAEARLWAYENPKLWDRLIDLLVESTSIYLERQIDAGAEVVQIFDSWAGALPDWAFRAWTIEPIKAIISHLRSRHPDTPIIGFPRGAGALYAEFVQETGVDAVSIDTNVPLEWAARELQPMAAVQGNLDPAMLLSGGEPLLREVDRIVDVMANGRFIFNLGHGVIKDTPPAHVLSVVEHIRRSR